MINSIDIDYISNKIIQINGIINMTKTKYSKFKRLFNYFLSCFYFKLLIIFDNVNFC